MIPLRAQLAAWHAHYRLRRRFPRSVIHSGAAASPDSVLSEHSVLFQGAILQSSSLGPYSYVQSGTVLTNTDVGPFCSLAGGATIGLAAHPTCMVSTSPVFYDNQQPLPKFFIGERLFTDTLPRTTIGADVWIGHGAMIKAGVRIGVGAVVGAGAVVTQDVVPYAVVVGTPAREIRTRFPAAICQRLLESNWWEWPASKLALVAKSFADPEQFLASLERSR